MANFDKTTDENGQEWMELCGKLHPCRILSPGQTLRDPVAFQRNLDKTRADVRRRLAISEAKSWNKFVD